MSFKSMVCSLAHQLEARRRRVSRTGMARPSTRDLKLPAYLKLPRWQRLARCTERLTYLAQAYLVVARSRHEELGRQARKLRAKLREPQKINFTRRC